MSEPHKAQVKTSGRLLKPHRRQEPPLREPGHAVDITARIERRQVLSGLISEYSRAA
jgi:hypothetical protein